MQDIFIFALMKLKYKRILLKLSGESLMGNQEYGLDAQKLEEYASEIKKVFDLGCQVAIVIGGGNIFRGVDAQAMGIERAHGDYMGMLATVINGMAIQGALEKSGITTRLLSAIKMEQICEPFIRRRAIRHLEKERIVIFGAGTGNPFFTTDTAASLRAIEIDADVVLKGTRVNGIYSADPEKDADAVFYPNLNYNQVLTSRLNVMDMTAFTLCQENKLPIVVFNMNEPDNLLRIVQGQNVGTLVQG